jgi:hypothetical protein
VYPNPSNHLFTIDVDIDGEKEIVLYGTAGEKIYNQKVFDTKTQVDVSELSSGVYILSISTSEGIVRKKVTVQ